MRRSTAILGTLGILLHPLSAARGGSSRERQWAQIGPDQREVARFLWDYGQPLGCPRELVAMSLQESSLGRAIERRERPNDPYSVSAGTLGVGVKWAAIRAYGKNFTARQWADTKDRLINDWTYCADQAMIHIRKGLAATDGTWWNTWAHYNGGSHWQGPEAQEHARQVYRWWLVVSDKRP